MEEYYNELFQSDQDQSWENAPGKQVFIDALRDCVATGRLSPQASIIDIGCATGFLLSRIRQEVGADLDLAGVDFSSVAIEKGTERYPGLRLLCEDGTDTGLPEAAFDALTSYGVYEHFQNPAAGITEAARLLKPGGLFFVMVPTLGWDRTDTDEEGWYPERELEDSQFRQMQWNLKRPTWEAHFSRAGLTLYDIDASKVYGALKPGVFFFGEKPL